MSTVRNTITWFKKISKCFLIDFFFLQGRDIKGQQITNDAQCDSWGITSNLSGCLLLKNLRWQVLMSICWNWNACTMLVGQSNDTAAMETISRVLQNLKKKIELPHYPAIPHMDFPKISNYNFENIHPPMFIWALLTVAKIEKQIKSDWCLASGYDMFLICLSPLWIASSNLFSFL